MAIAMHALSAKDAAVMVQIRERLKGVKGTVTGARAPGLSSTKS